MKMSLFSSFLKAKQILLIFLHSFSVGVLCTCAYFFSGPTQLSANKCNKICSFALPQPSVRIPSDVLSRPTH